MPKNYKNTLKYNGSIIQTQNVLEVNYRINPKKIMQIKSGIINTSFLVDCDDSKYVFRVYQANNRSINDINKELTLCKKLKASGLPVPLVYKNNNSKEIVNFEFGNKIWAAALFECLPGRHLKHTDKSLINDVSRIHARMHFLLQDKTSKQKSSFIPQLFNLINSESVLSNKKLRTQNKLVFLNNLQSIKQQVLAELRHRKHAINTLPKGYCHLDYDSSNILTDSKTVSGIIDFDDMAVAPFIVDVAFSLWWWLFYNKFDQQIFDSYLQAYQTVRNISRNEFEYIFLFLRARNIFLAYILFVNQAKIDILNLKRILLFDKWIKDKYEKNSFS